MSETTSPELTPQINIFLDSKDYIYHPGDCVTGHYRILDVKTDQINSVELSVLWHTEGKGDEDMTVIDYHILSRQREDWINPHNPGKIDTVLPSEPLSYEGQIIKIRWLVRVRMTLVSGEEIIAERGFFLKNDF
ncbi:MAG: hypothetical protein IJF84_05695 [Thermoguttaceae bacterium]|nr:hypothetical protein [Thermoguttaceae bacterium]